MTDKKMIGKIEYIASISSWFKIGETSQKLYDRLKQHPPKYHRIKPITRSKFKKRIDEAERKMNDHFKNRKNCDNKKGGSAGRMATKSTYILYVIYVKKRK
jgi:hypothetical protein